MSAAPLAHGIDLVLSRRIEQMWREHAERFLDRIYTTAEQRYCLDAKNPAERLSGRFAVKEAVLKALGTGWRGGIEFRDVETLPDPYGRPIVTLYGKASELARTLGIRLFLVSISHAGDYAMASVIGIGEAD